jgi:hypothetical protein
MPDTEIPGADPGALIVSLVPILLWALALVCAGLAILRGPRPIERGFVIDRLLRYLFLFPLGVQGLWAFFCQVFLPEETANAIGWEPSPFQFEVGLANLGLGLASFYAAFSDFRARSALAIFAGCFLAGAGVGHLIDIAQGDNLTAGNAGPILYTDFLTPIVVLALLLLVPRSVSAGVALKQPKPEPKPVKAQSPAKDEVAQVEVGKKTQPPTAPSRIEDELETARKSMRESLRGEPKPEILPPLTPGLSSQPRAHRRKKHLPEAQD